jgi:hypothetical protein
MEMVVFMLFTYIMNNIYMQNDGAHALEWTVESKHGPGLSGSRPPYHHQTFHQM